jgi:hypothetical protein
VFPLEVVTAAVGAALARGTFECEGDPGECEARADLLESQELTRKWSCTSVEGGVRCESTEGEPD